MVMALGPAFIATKGYAAPEVEHTYARARALCQQVGDTPRRFPTLLGLMYVLSQPGGAAGPRGSWGNSSAAGPAAAGPAPSWRRRKPSGMTLLLLGDYAAAWRHLEPGLAPPPRRRSGAPRPALAWRRGAVSGLCGPHAVVPGLSRAGRAAESGGAGAGPGAGASL